MATQTPTQLRAGVPGAWQEATNRGETGGNPVGPVDYTWLTNLVDTVIARAPKYVAAAATAAALGGYVRSGAVITANAVGAIGLIDSAVTLLAGDFLLLQDGAAGLDDGLYYVTNPGAAGAKFVLTRSDDFTTGDSVAGALIFVDAGTANGQQLHVVTNLRGADVVGTTAITFSTLTALGLSAVAALATVATGSESAGTSLFGSRVDHLHDHGLLATLAALYHDDAHCENTSSIQGGVGNVKLVHDYLDGLMTIVKEPSGFASVTEATLTFDDAGPREFTIAAAVTTFSFYVRGVTFLKNAPETVAWTDVEGYHYFYYSPTGVLTHSVNLADWLTVLRGDGALVAAIHWDAATGVSDRRMDERHGFMDGPTHEFLHRAFGARWLDGGALGGITIGDGSTNAMAQFDVGTVSIADEDLIWNWVDGVPQDLTPIAQLPCFYRLGATGLWRMAAADDYAFIQDGKAGYVAAAGRIAYNEWTGATWQLTEIAANGRFCLVHVFVTNDTVEPLIAIVGQEEYLNLGLAQTGAETELANLVGISDLLAQEASPLGTVILQSSGAYGNAVGARVVQTAEGGDYIDFRQRANAGVSGLASDHGSLSGLADDDHLQYSLVDGTRAFTGVVGGIDPTADAHLATRLYVDEARHPDVDLMDSGGLGASTRVGNVITANGNGAMPAWDGQALVLGSRCAFQSGTAPDDNGLMIATDLGSAGTPWILTRVTDMADGYDASGSHFFVQRGALSGQKMFKVLEDAVTGAIINTDSITLVEAHGLHADGAALFHDTDQAEDMSLWAETDATDALNEIRSALGTKIVTGGQTSDGANITVILYDVDYTAMMTQVAALAALFTAGTNVVLVGAGSGAIPCYELNGTAGVVLTGDNFDKEVALVAILVGGAVELHGVFGAQAATGTAVAPTSAQIDAALVSAAIATHDTTCGVIWARILYAQAAAAVVATHRNIDTYAALAEERVAGTLR